jgi:glycosyltransferase involved in cell wall biosynthesis
MTSAIDALRALIIVPAFNEEDAVGGVIEDIRAALPNATPLVIDDGSRDRTGMIAHAYGARVVRLPFNLGIGGAVQTGYRIGAEEDFDVVVQVDGDGQHPAAAARTLLGALLDSDANYVIGSRFTEGGCYRASRARRSGIRLFARLVSMIIRQPVTDTTSGLRAADRQAIRVFAEHYPHDYPEVEAVILAKRAGLRISEVPVDMRQRVSGRSSITPFRSLYYMVKVTLAVLVQCMERNPAGRST